MDLPVDTFCWILVRLFCWKAKLHKTTVINLFSKIAIEIQGYSPMLTSPRLYLARSCYNLTTLCLNGTLPCVFFVDVTLGDIPNPTTIYVPNRTDQVRRFNLAMYLCTSVQLQGTWHIHHTLKRLITCMERNYLYFYFSLYFLKTFDVIN